MSGISTSITINEETTDEAGLQTHDNPHLHTSISESAEWPSANTSTSPEMIRLETQKGERDTSTLKK